MSLKIKQSLVLLSVILIEIVGFNNQWKYVFLDWLNPRLADFFSVNLIWFKVAIIAISIALIYYLRYKLRKIEAEPLFIVYLIKGFQVRGSDIIGILNVIFVLCSVSWISIEIFFQTIDGFLNALIYASFMILYALMIANSFLTNYPEGKKQSPKILISALSLVREDILRQCIAEMKLEYMKDKWLDQKFSNPDGTPKLANDNKGPALWGPWANLDPIRKSIIEHKASFQEIILISSSEATKVFTKFPDDLKPEPLIADFINKYYPRNKASIKIVADGTSGNDMIENGFGIERIIQSLYKKGFKDHDIMFNVTGATVAISGAMLLKALKGERRAEYSRQDEGNIEEINLSIATIKDLWYDLLEQVG